MAETPFYRKGRVRSLPLSQFKKRLPLRNRVGNYMCAGLCILLMAFPLWLLSRPHPTWFFWEDGCTWLATTAVISVVPALSFLVAALFSYRRARQAGEYAYFVKAPDALRVLRFGWRSSFHLFWRDKTFHGTQPPGPLLRDAFCFLCFAALSWLLVAWGPHLVFKYRRMLDPEIVADRQVFALVFGVSAGVWVVASMAKVTVCVWAWRKLLWCFVRLVIRRTWRWTKGLHFANFGKRFWIHAALVGLLVLYMSFCQFAGSFCPPPLELRDLASGQWVRLPDDSPCAFLELRQSLPAGVECWQLGTRERMAGYSMLDGDESSLFSNSQLHYLARARSSYYRLAFDTAVERGVQRAIKNGWGRAKVGEITEVYCTLAKAVRAEPLLSWEEAAARIHILDDRLSLTMQSKTNPKAWDLNDNTLPDGVPLYADWCRLHCSGEWLVLWTTHATVVARPSTGTLFKIIDPTRYTYSYTDGQAPTVGASTVFLAVIVFLFLAPIVYLTPAPFVLRRPGGTKQSPLAAKARRSAPRSSPNPASIRLYE